MSQLRVTSGTLQVPAGSITDEFVATPTGSTQPINEVKVVAFHKAGTGFGLDVSGTPANREDLVFVATFTGTVKAVRAGMMDTGSTGNITVDCSKNGSSILSSVITVSNTNQDREVIDGSINDAGLSPGDFFTLKLSNAASDGAGPFAFLEIAERAN